MPGVDSTWLDIALRLLLALAVGSAIGYERSFKGRPAGLRTHALVCLASAVLMIAGVWPELWMKQVPGLQVEIDPTRIMQGIMTGVGFLGAGTIIKDAHNVRGLTTAASVWATAALGIMIGIGFLAPAVIAVAIVLGTLSVFRWFEDRMPSYTYASVTIAFALDEGLGERKLREMIGESGCAVVKLSQRFDRDRDRLEYRTVVRSLQEGAMEALVRQVRAMPSVRHMRIAPWSV